MKLHANRFRLAHSDAQAPSQHDALAGGIVRTNAQAMEETRALFGRIGDIVVNLQCAQKKRLAKARRGMQQGRWATSTMKRVSSKNRPLTRTLAKSESHATALTASQTPTKSGAGPTACASTGQEELEGVSPPAWTCIANEALTRRRCQETDGKGRRPSPLSSHGGWGSC